VVWRFVNEADIVPHLPLKPGMDFWHEATEVKSLSHFHTIPSLNTSHPHLKKFDDLQVWRENSTYVKTCDSSGEDPTCSDSLKISLSVYDHLHYFGPETNGCTPWPQ
jgi:Zn ribbon nucleic-acid-binding protein